MKTLSTSAKTDAAGRLVLDLATDMPESELDVVVVLQPSTTRKKDPKRLLNLPRVLQWEGDAVAEQRKLRDEWPD